ncbi:MAG: hypothetical protein JO353_09815 [Phycisphaerae bacterium]|nr:hypothetical protein [Phycisphaerae bacterium]
MESEQSAIWAIIAFGSIENREIEYQPLYRFVLRCDSTPTTKPASDVQRGFLQGAITFLRTVNEATAASASSVESDQLGAFKTLHENIAVGHSAFKQVAYDDIPAMPLRPNELQGAQDVLLTAKKLDEESKDLVDAFVLAA